MCSTLYRSFSSTSNSCVYQKRLNATPVAAGKLVGENKRFSRVPLPWHAICFPTEDSNKVKWSGCAWRKLNPKTPGQHGEFCNTRQNVRHRLFRVGENVDHRLQFIRGYTLMQVWQFHRCVLGMTRFRAGWRGLWIFVVFVHNLVSPTKWGKWINLATVSWDNCRSSGSELLQSQLT